MDSSKITENFLGYEILLENKLSSNFIFSKLYFIVVVSFDGKTITDRFPSTSFAVPELISSPKSFVILSNLKFHLQK